MEVIEIVENNRKLQCNSFSRLLNDAPDFEETLEVVDLTDSHRDEDQRFKERPHHDPEHMRVYFK